MNLDKKALSGFIKEIEDSRTRQKGETEFQREVLKRAKEKHFDTKAMRIVLQRRAMDAGKRDEQDYNVHAYELALGAKKLAVEAMEQGASAREAAKALGLPRAAVTALKAGTENEDFEPHSLPSSAPVAASEKEVLGANLGVAAGAGRFDVQETAKSCGGGENRRPAEAGNKPGSTPGEELEPAPTRLVGTVEEGSSKARAGVATGPQDTSPIVVGLDTRPEGTSLFQRITGAFVDPTKDDDLTIPKFLRRTA